MAYRSNQTHSSIASSKLVDLSLQHSPMDPLEEVRADGLKVLSFHSAGHVFILHEAFDVQRKFAEIRNEERKNM